MPVNIHAQAQPDVVPDSLVAIVDSILEADSIAVEAEAILMPDTTPEWYVEPVIPEHKRSPRRAKTAASCMNDSIQTYDVNEVLVEVVSYDYDNVGRIIRSIKWACNPDGSRIGTFKEEYGFDAAGRQVMTAVYEWVSSINNWKGTEKTEFAYDGELMISSIEYAWVNEAWVADKKITWKYDDQERVYEYFEYVRDKNTNQLVYSKGFAKEWDTEDRLVLDIVYKTYSNGVWTAGTKKETKYDANGNTTEYTYYAGLTNGNWGAAGSTHELWEFSESNDNTGYEKDVWSNGGWVGSEKKRWEYTSGNLTLLEKFVWSNETWAYAEKEEWAYTSGKNTRYEKYVWENGVKTGVNKEIWQYSGSNPTLYEKYSWVSNDWTIAEQEVTTYTSGKKTRYEKNVWVNGVKTGVSMEKWEYSGNNQTLHEKYSWADNDWTISEQEKTTYSSGKKTEYEKYVWINGVKTGVSRETWEYLTDNKTIHDSFTWNDGWVNSEEEVTVLTSGKQTLYEKYKWVNGVKEGVTKKECEYTSGKQTSQVDYVWENSDWAKSQKQVWGYSGNDKILQEKYTWSNNDWVYVEKEEWGYKSGKLTMHATYNIAAGAFVGGEKNVWDFNASGVEILHEQYAWSNDKWNIISRDAAAYDAEGNRTLVEECYLVDGVFTGIKKEEYTFNAAKQKIVIIVYAWINNDWIYSTKSEADYDGDVKIMDAKYNWQSGKWVGDVRTDSYYSDGKLTNVRTYSWDNSTDQWTDAARRWIVYDEKGRPLGDTTQTYVNSEWVNYSISTHEYDEKGHDIMAVVAVWNGSEWVPTSITKATYTYTESGQLLLMESYTGLEGSWTGIQKVEYTYDAAGHQTKYMQYEWRNGNWGNKTKSEKSYDAAGNLILSQSYTWSSNAWAGTNKYEYAYDEAGRETKKARYTWETKKKRWKGADRNDTEYDEDGNISASISFGWVANAWVEETRESFVRDSQGRVVEYVTSVWMGDVWANNRKNSFVYNSKGEIVSTHRYTWNNNEWTLFLVDDKEYDLADNKLRREVYGSWNEGVLESYEDKRYFYDCDFQSFTIRFTNYDGTLLASYEVKQTKTPTYTGEIPTKPAAEHSTFEFAGWSPEIVAVTGDATYQAVFVEVPNKHTITWIDGDGKTLKTEQVAYGETPDYVGDVPTKAETAQYTYAFNNTWTPAIVAVTGDATYTAQFNNTLRSYTITWLNDDNSVIDKTNVDYGVVPTHANATKTNTAEYTYTFAGWDNTPVAVTGDATYKATFSSTKNSYTITWLNDDNTLIDKTTVEYGVVPTHADATKAATAEYTYTFAGWDNTPIAVTGDATYKATFNATKNSYTITWLNDDNTLIDKTTVEYGVVPTHADASKAATAEFTYTFAGWDNTPVAVTGDTTYKATFSSTKNKYTVTFKNDGGTTIESKQWEYGATPTCVAPEKATTAQYTYEFAGWTPKVVAVAEDATYTATYASHLRSYTVKFLNEDGSVFEEGVWDYGCLPLISAEPTKEATAQYTYTFAGWTPTVTNVMGDATYTATFTQTVNTYTITWLYDDETLIDKTTVEYGIVPTHADASKAATAEYTYTFTGWTPELVSVTGDATYKATFSATKNSYTITWLNDDESLIDKTTVEYGIVPTHADASKAATAEYTYTFTGWDNTPVAVTGDATYKATFSATKNSYTITWLNEDNSLIDKTTVEYGVVPTHADATKENTAEFTYTFAGWDNTPVAVTGDATYKATFSATKNKYTITWIDGDGKTLKTEQVTYGETPVYTGETPTKAQSAQYSYEFNNTWSPAIVAVVGEATYTAQFTSIVREYTITWIDGDGKTLKTEQVAYGETPVYSGETPTKAQTAQYLYEFNNTWSPAIEAVTGEATYTAQFTSIVREYTITWIDGDGNTLKTEQVAYGETPAYTGETPTKAQTAQYSYEFNNTWSPAIEAVTGEATYTAQFTSIVREYTITWIDGDGNTLKFEQVAYGETPEYEGETPTKTETAQYSYEFNNTWSPAIEAVTGEATYTAQFESIVREYTITWVDGDGNTLKTEQVAYGETPEYVGETPTKTETAQYSYEFNNTWSPAIVAVTGEATYTAQFASIVREYTITWIDGDGNTLKTEQVAYGETPEYVGETPTKAETAQYLYEFNNTWSPAIEAVTGEATYTAQFTSIVREYTITWIDGDGKTLKTEQVAYGETPAYTGETPTKAETAQYSYEFNDTWSPAIVAVTGEATYTAQFTSIVREYTITWIDGDGNTLKTEQVAYGETPEYAGETPTKTETAQYSYEFNNTWSPAIVAVTGEATYTAQFTSIVREYTITWIDGDGNTLKTVQVAYGETPEYVGETPTKTETAQYSYEFNDTWSPEIVAVTGDATYTAQFESIVREYTITITAKDWSEQRTLPYGTDLAQLVEQIIAAKGDKVVAADSIYTLIGWSPELAIVTEDATYEALYTAEARTYTITWLDEDGTLLDEQDVEYGVMPEYAGETPTKEDDEIYMYTFSGWNPAIAVVTGDATYVATYTAEEKPNTAIGDVTTNEPAVKVIENDLLYIIRGGMKYAVQGARVR